MAKVIDKAIKQVEKGNEKKRKRDDPEPKKSKKQKVEEEESEEDINDDEKERDELRRKELKSLLMKYPDVTIEKTKEVDIKIKKMSTDEVKMELMNLKIEIGLQQPGETAKGIIGLAGLLLQKYSGDKTIYKRFITDQELIAAVDQLCPSLDDHLTVPLKICHRIGGHLSAAMFEEQPDVINQ